MSLVWTQKILLLSFLASVLRSYCWDSGMLYIKIASKLYSVLYLKELYKFISSIWSKKQLKEIPLRALKVAKCLKIFFCKLLNSYFGPKCIATFATFAIFHCHLPFLASLEMEHFDVQTSYGGLKVSEFNQEFISDV